MQNQQEKLNFKFTEYQEMINVLSDDQKAKLPDLDQSQRYLEVLENTPENFEEELQKHELGKRSVIHHLINEEFLDVLIKIYENPIFENPDENVDISKFRNQLNTDRARINNQINRIYGKQSSKIDIKNNLFALTPSQHYPNAYEYNTNLELQSVVGKIAEYFMKNGEQTPITFTINPAYDSSNQQDESRRNEMIIQQVLTATANKGYAPDDIRIVIDGVPKAISADSLGKDQYMEWANTAKRFREKVVNQVKSDLSSFNP